MLYAAGHPEKVQALVLSALPLAAPPPTEVNRWTDVMVWTHEHLVPNYYPRYFYTESLKQLYGTPWRLKPETVDWYYKTNTVAGGFARVRAYYKANLKGLWAKGAGKDAAAVKVPVLLQWGDRDVVLPKYLADTAVKEFSGTKVQVIHYPDVGHYPMLELPVETGRDLKAFLDRITAAHTPAVAAR